MSVRVRFAPSPTGALHVGGARTALFNFLFAKKQKGSFVIRIEDTDQERHQEHAISPLLKELSWLGLSWDEGPYLSDNEIKYKGAYGPYRQKDRLSLYREKARQLIAQGKAYYCFMSSQEEAKLRQKAIERGRAWRAKSPYRDLPLSQAEEKIQKGESFCIRFKSPSQRDGFVIEDLLRGSVHFPSDSLGDFILVRTDGFPVYNFSCAVDDILMEISHVFRGEEHLPNSLKQKLIQEALGFKPPQSAHLSIIVGENKKKLSKRTGAKSLSDYKNEGCLPQALSNFLALLGWNPGSEKEFFSLKELIQEFDIKGLNPSSAFFDESKLFWLNERHIKSLPTEELGRLVQPFLKHQARKEELLSLIPPLLSGFKSLKQGGQILDLFLDEEFSIHESAREALLWPKSKVLLNKWLGFLKECSKNTLDMEDIKAFQKKIQAEDHIRGKEFFMPLRCALMGRPEGLEMKVLIGLYPKVRWIQRAERLLQQL